MAKRSTETEINENVIFTCECGAEITFPIKINATIDINRDTNECIIEPMVDFPDELTCKKCNEKYQIK